MKRGDSCCSASIRAVPGRARAGRRRSSRRRRLQTTSSRTQASGTGADIAGAQANLAIKRNALARQQALLKQGFTTRADYDDALNEVRTAESELADARARAANASAAIAPGRAAGDRPGPGRGRQGQLDLSRTEVRAPMDGVVENADRLQVGQMAVHRRSAWCRWSAAQTAWVEANFKEKDLGRMVPGQRAKIEVDAYPRPEVRPATSRASAPAPAANSRCFRRRTPTAIGSR